MGEDYLSQPINIGGKGLFRKLYYTLLFNFKRNEITYR